MGKKTQARLSIEEHNVQVALKALHTKRDDQKTAKKRKNEYKKMGGELILETIPAKPPKDAWIKNPRDWKPKYYTKKKQQLAFLRWLICKYPIPTFLLSNFLRPQPDMLITNKNRVVALVRWQDVAYKVAHGASLFKLVDKALTKRECYYFLQAPATNTICGNMWWARGKALEIPKDLLAAFVSKVDEYYLAHEHSSKWFEFIEFIKKFEGKLDAKSVEDLFDFIDMRWEDLQTLKGRTVESVVRLANGWHRETVVRKRYGPIIAWDGLPIKPWEFKGESGVWKVVQLNSSDLLAEEGNKQHHCIAGYAHACASGRSHIFSLRKMRKDNPNKEDFRVTVEVRGQTIAQARGKLNASIDSKAKSVLLRWAKHNGFIMGRYI